MVGEEVVGINPVLAGFEPETRMEALGLIKLVGEEEAVEQACVAESVVAADSGPAGTEHCEAVSDGPGAPCAVAEAAVAAENVAVVGEPRGLGGWGCGHQEAGAAPVPESAAAEESAAAVPCLEVEYQSGVGAQLEVQHVVE